VKTAHRNKRATDVPPTLLPLCGGSVWSFERRRSLNAGVAESPSRGELL
jgi:hypothetical protein